MAEIVDISCDNEQSIEDTETVTLSEVLQEEQNLFADACAVLGASDDKNCTYSEGYLKRQALYACLTCIPEAKADVTKRAGVCLACTFHCHDGHELVELYTKRNFRCDCGNSKFPNRHCNLYKDKTETNELNVYNQNFSGLYCVCQRPYPDPDDSVMDQMIQCLICEDWFHERHLGVPVPKTYAEVICESCVRKHDFLLHYEGLSVVKMLPDQNNSDVEIEGDEKEMSTSDMLNQILNPKSVSKNTDDANINIMNGKGDNSGCKKPLVKSNVISTKFLLQNTWRQQLCKCENCLNMYAEEGVSFLTDMEDTVQVYEEKGKAVAMQDEVNALNSLDRVPLMEAINGYNELKSHLSEYLKKFDENKKVVREEDIREFFSSMDARKKFKTNIPHFCR